MKANEVIKNYIVSNGIKQSYVAEKTGIPFRNLSASLDGKRKIPADEFVKICAVLSLDIDDFKEETLPA